MILEALGQIIAWSLLGLAVCVVLLVTLLTKWLTR